MRRDDRPTPTPSDDGHPDSLPRGRSGDASHEDTPTHAARATGPATPSRASLTERYIWAVVRTLPRERRAEEERELRSLVEDTIEARTAAGQDPSAAERATLEELGDPSRLAGRLGERPRYLVGPELYPDLVKLLKVVLGATIPFVLLGMLIADTLEGHTLGPTIGQAVWTSFNAGVHIVFWTTLVFWVIERTRHTRGPLTPWSLDDLPERTELGTTDRRFTTGEFLGAVGFQVIWVGALVALTHIPLFADEGGARVPLLARDLWNPWLGVLVAIAAVETLVTVLTWRRGTWGWTAAGVNVAANVLVALTLVHLLVTERLLNPAALAGMQDVEKWGGVAATAIALTIVVVALWDSVEGIRRAISSPTLGARPTSDPEQVSPGPRSTPR